MNVIKSIFSRLSPAGKKAKLSIFIFHRVLAEPDKLFPDEIDARRFDQALGWIKSWFNVLPLDEAAKRLKSESLPERAASITFDDGYADNYSIARPLLQRHGLCATFFIATGFLDGGRMWNDTVIEAVRRSMLTELNLSSVGLGSKPIDSIEQKRSAIETIISGIKYKTVAERVFISERIAALAIVKPPTDLMMTTDEVIRLRDAGMQIGAHTVSHPILARLGAADVRREIAESKAHLEAALGNRVSLFAYPNGMPGQDYRREDTEIVRELDFDAAVSTAWGTASLSCDIMQLPRFTPWDKTRTKFGARLIRNFVSKHV